MGDKSKIEWTDASWTPIRARNKETGKVGWHCEHVTPGCENCYAETLNKRLGTGFPFKPGHRKDVDLFLDEAMLLKPLHWRKPRMIFVCSMTDLFADFVPDAWIDKVFAVMALCPHHTFQILTKRSKRMRQYCSEQHAEHRITSTTYLVRSGGNDNTGMISWPLPNVWLGVSCEDQQRADERIPDLLDTPAAVRFVSAEPLLGPIDFENIEITSWLDGLRKTLRPEPYSENWPKMFWDVLRGHQKWEDKINQPKIDWIICGGESGAGHRPMQIEWAESIRQQCAKAGTAFFFKQDSGSRSGMRGRASDDLWACKQFPQAPQ